MTIDSIITEWTYRLPKGYPETEQDYSVLYDVLQEMTTFTTEERDRIVNQARGINTNNEELIESLDYASIENVTLQQAINQENKQQEFIQFLKSLPTDADTIVLKFLNTLTDPTDCVNFAKVLYSYDNMSEETLNSIDFRSGLLNTLFRLEPKGLGKGEILLAVLFSNSKINGSGASYDMTVNSKAYEIKDYTGGTAKFQSIRLGTKGSVTRFEFWDEIVDTLRRLDKLQGSIENPKFNFRELFNDSMMQSINYLQDRKTFILAGNLNFKDQEMLNVFYKEANTLNSDIKGYTNVILRGPNATPIEMSIEPLTKTKSGELVIKPIEDDTQNITYVTSELRRLKYVRDPFALNDDMQRAVDTITNEDLQFIIFRKDRIRITNEFKFVVVDAGRIRIIEKSVGAVDPELTEEINEEGEW
jgi:hypothetical protein